MKKDDDRRYRFSSQRKKAFVLWLCALLCLLLAGCARQPLAEPLCTVLWQDHEQVHFYRQVFEVSRGEDLTVTVGIPAGQRIAQVSYPDSHVSACVRTVGWMEEYRITLHRVCYPVSVALTLSEARTTVYHIGSSLVTVQETGARLRVNTRMYSEELERPGALAVGWRIQSSGEIVGFGSRYTPEAPVTDLEPVYLPCSHEADFEYETRGDGAVITGYSGSGDLVLPSRLGGLPVIGIAAGAFGMVEADTVAFPPALRTIEEGAFASLKTDQLYLFDGLTELGDASFGTASIACLHINAMRAPVYCGSWFDTFTEKTDRLALLKEHRKLVLFCGSSARFGYDSAMLEAAFPAFRVINMGVYAYANMLPQARILARYLQPGDVVLSSPQLDAIDCQFCGETDFDPQLFAMVESNYDLLTLLDLREYTGVFNAFAEYQAARSRMTERTYQDIPAHYDEDGVYHAELTYNEYGDYILHRENNLDRRLFGIKRASYHASAIRECDWQGLNAVYADFMQQGARVLFTYSPRSEHSITDESSAQSIADLDRLLRERLCVPVISAIDDSLMDAFYFYATDNHLSSEGVQLHTSKVIEDLRKALEEMP